MIGISKLLFEAEYNGDKYRFRHGAGGHRHGTGEGMGPVVVWNCTRTCNLNCVHCYSDSENKQYGGELTTAEAFEMIDDLARFRVPVLLISGGEPLVRPDLFEIIAYAGERGIRCTLSTNGTRIDPEMAQRIKDASVTYVGISLDGVGEQHDFFRGVAGSYEKALAGIRNCLAVGQKVGLRFTLSQQTVSQLDAVFQLIQAEGIPRVCFYHLVPAGRGSHLSDGALSHAETRSALEKITAKALELGPDTEILTVDNHADSVWLYLKAQKDFPEKAPRMLELISQNGGNRSGMAIGCISADGNVHPDQFSRGHTLGNIRQKPFSQIWQNPDDPILSGLKDRKMLLEGRCSPCKWLNLCNGNFRTRAEALTGNLWASDPACYLTDEEIGITEENL